MKFGMMARRLRGLVVLGSDEVWSSWYIWNEAIVSGEVIFGALVRLDFLIIDKQFV